MRINLALQLILTAFVQSVLLDPIWNRAKTGNNARVGSSLSQAPKQHLLNGRNLSRTDSALFQPEASRGSSASFEVATNLDQHRTKTGHNELLPSLIVGQQPGSEYVVVVDCGSSGSRVQIYHWPRGTPRSAIAKRTQALRDPTTNRHLEMRIKPGLSSVRDNPDAASDYLEPIMRFASKNVPVEQQGSTRVYILGTAGLRSLKIKERAEILEDVIRDLSKEFHFESIIAYVISGSEEGFFQWLSVNSLARRLGSDFNQAQLGFYFQAPYSRRYGVVEMGGVSAQVAFEITPAMDQFITQRLRNSPEALHVFKSLRLEVNLSEDQDPRQTMRVFSVSFLGFGSDYARSLAIDLLARDGIQRLRQFGMLPLLYQPNSTLVVEDPCLPRNSEDSMLKPASLLYNAARTIGYTARPSEEAILVRLVGRGNFAQCRTLMNRLIMIAMRERTTCMQLDQHGICDNSLIGTNFIPWQNLQFLGIGDLYYTSKMLRCQGHFNGIDCLYETANLCSKTINEIDMIYPANDEFSRIRNMLTCFKATWILSWLNVVLKMPIDGSVDLTTTDKIMHEDVDWKLGATIAKTVGYKGVNLALAD